MRLTQLLIPVSLVSAAMFLAAQAPKPAASQKKNVPERKAGLTPVAQNYKLSGSPSAPITLELYTDYECPSCRMLYLEVLPPLEAQYIATGKVRLLHRDYPLAQHQYSKLAAKYANAGGQIGKYELVAGQIFKMQPDWAQNGNVDGVVAKVLSPADMAKVRDLVKGDPHLDDTVNADVAMGTKDNLNQTPTLVFVKNGKRQKIDGSLPFTILKSYIDQMLAKG